MSNYTFNLINHEEEGQLKDKSQLSNRPFAEIDSSFQADAARFIPGEELATAMNTALAVGQPLLITGEPGTGKTQAAYYAAYKLNIEPVLHFQVKSDSTARDLLYHFDTVRYFHDAHIQNTGKTKGTIPDKSTYVEKRELYEAFKTANKKKGPRILLIDEIDKAPRDFPNDLLHELDKMEFTIPETGQKITAPQNLRPIVFITSNSERRLPEPFLRRCVFHHIRFNEKIIEQAVAVRSKEFLHGLSDGFIKLAIERFLSLRTRTLRKQPATGELLLWLRVLALTAGTYPEQLDEDLSKLPYLEMLLKDHNDMKEVMDE
ncbi:MAG: MoxR family ATPase [bacterium]|nr:MoxR family ATPase [bacterium]